MMEITQYTCVYSTQMIKIEVAVGKNLSSRLIER